ncbi:hypothetical protein HPP92_005745 [Vanilla planifolia]|uniref:AP2/ERF domain-containing protein n=1 Tax=Vanilla planifolia TaxID=51239 RepID=A0A835RM97_VANPL|nr:hypothetical protein HPP92_005745 [Vanilla planifolia]
MMMFGDDSTEKRALLQFISVCKPKQLPYFLQMLRKDIMKLGHEMIWGLRHGRKAARAYDLAALKYWGPSIHTNFPLENYQEEMEEMKNMTRQEYVAHLRRKSSGFSRGASIYRGVTRHHQHGRWQARIGRVAGNKDLYLGTFGTQEEAAEAYDIAAIKFRGVNAVTNFDITRYDVDKIISSNTLLSSELARKKKAVVEDNNGTAPNQNYGREMDLTEDNSSCGSDWKMVLYQSPQHHESVPDEKPMLLHGLFGVEAVHLSQRCDESSLKRAYVLPTLHH